MDSQDTFFTMPKPIFIPQEEFNLFHAIDRELYSVLVNDLWRDPLESMQVMTLWLWVERWGYRNVVNKILSLPPSLINDVAEEAVTCLNCINNSSQSTCESIEIPMTESLMEEGIALQFFHEKRAAIIRKFAKIEIEVCSRALTDIMQQAIRRNNLLNIAASQTVLSPARNQSFVHPVYARLGLAAGKLMIKGRTQENEVPPEDRTMFVTFSKGYPVSAWEVRHFFTRTFGKCMESLYMEEVAPAEQSLFARIVFFSVSTIDLILNGQEKVKFTINGKHIWARKFVPKPKRPSPRASLSPLPPHNLPGAF